MKTRLSEKMNAIYLIGKFWKYSKKKLAVEKSRFQADLTISEISDFPRF